MNEIENTVEDTSGDVFLVENLEIRRATLDDRDEIVRLLLNQFADFTVDAALHPVPSLESAVEYFDRVVIPYLETGAIFVAIDKDSPVAGGILGWSHWLPANTPTETLYRAVIGWTYVLPKYRRQEIGKRLRQAAAKHCLEQGYEVMVATLEVGNPDQLNVIPGENPVVATINVQVRLNEIVFSEA